MMQTCYACLSQLQRQAKLDFGYAEVIVEDGWHGVVPSQFPFHIISFAI